MVGSIDDIEIVIDSPDGESIPAAARDAGGGTFEVDFCPTVAGEHQIYLSFGSEPIPGSPFACKVRREERSRWSRGSRAEFPNSLLDLSVSYPLASVQQLAAAKD